MNILEGNKSSSLIVLFTLFLIIALNIPFLKYSFYKISSENLRIFEFTSSIKTILFNNNIGSYALLEIKLIERNKRLQGFFIIAILILIAFFYALQTKENGLYFSFAIYIIVSGIFGYIFSQYLYSWESSYFEFIWSTKFDLYKYLRIKYLLYVISGIIVCVFFFPLFIQGRISIHLFLTALLFNSCVGYFFSFFLATFNHYRIDLNRNIFFNLQGFNGTQLIGLSLIVLFPTLMLVTLTTFLEVSYSLIIINIICIFSICNQKRWFKLITKQLLKRKYINLEGYRK
jgi:hypothetical protein